MALLQKTSRNFTPPVRLKCSEWTLQRRKLSPEATSKAGGSFSFKDAPWQEEVLDAPNDPTVGEVVLMWASQVTGKTETLNNMVGYTIDIDPCPILNLQPTLEMGETWSKDRLATMLRDTPALRGKVRDARSRDANNTILHKGFRGGHITIAGANSAASLASRPIRKVFFDEIDRYPQSAGTEGDPIALAEKRTESFPDAVRIKTSTPTIKKVSKIEKAFDASDKRYWFCPCPHCKHEQHLKWGQVKWLGDETDVFNLQIWYECEACLKPWNDRERQAAVRAGKWKATAPFRGVRGYHLNGVYCLFAPQKPFKNRLQQMVSAFLKAKAGGKYTYMVWVNTFLAETWEDETEVIESGSLMQRREDYGPELPDEVLLLTAGIDAQKDRLEIEIDGWGANEESWAVEYIVVPCELLKGQWHSELDQVLLNRVWKTKSGRELRIRTSAFDCSAFTSHVHAYCRPRFGRNIFAVKGSNQAGEPVIGSLMRAKGRKCPYYRLGTDTAKDIIYGRLKIAPIKNPNGTVFYGPGYMHYTRRRESNFDETYFKMLTAESLRVKHVKGYPVRYYEKEQDARNEAIDLRVYSLAALYQHPVDWILLTKNIEKQQKRQQKEYQLRESPASEPDAPKEQPEPPKPVLQPARRPFVRPLRPGKNFVTGWKKW
jgi:phage terminase large subunit GpA-like protein